MTDIEPIEPEKQLDLNDPQQLHTILTKELNSISLTELFEAINAEVIVVTTGTRVVNKNTDIAVDIDQVVTAKAPCVMYIVPDSKWRIYATSGWLEVVTGSFGVIAISLLNTMISFIEAAKLDQVSNMPWIKEVMEKSGITDIDEALKAAEVKLK